MNRAFSPAGAVVGATPRRPWLVLAAVFAAIALVSGACGSGGDASEANEAAPTEPAAVQPTPEPETEEPVVEEAAAGDADTEDTAAADAAEEETATTPDADETDTEDESTTASGNQISSLESSACPFDSIVPLPREPDCFVLTVPEDWDAPDSAATVTIPIARFPAVTDSGKDPVVYLEGGPGGHSLDGLMFQYPVLVAPFNETRDFIVYDQRGAGHSTPSLACPEVTAASQAAAASAGDADEEAAAELTAVAECRDRLLADGVALDEYHSINSANDLDALRTQLDYEQLNVLGISYGTRLAQTYARLYPESMRSSVLDSVDPIEAELFSALSTNAQRAFGELFDGCEADPVCAGAYPDLEERYFALVDRLDADPQTIEAVNPLTGATQTLVVTGADLLSSTFSALYNQAFFAAVPQLVADGEANEYPVLEAMASQALIQADFVSVGMNLSVQCHEDIPFDDRSRLDSYEPVSDDYAQFSERVSGEELFDACEVWPSGTAEAVEDELVTSDVPTLLLGGAYDPITPTSGFDQITPGLSTSWEVVFPHDGHGVSPTPCGALIVNAFFEDPFSEPDSSCAGETSSPRFAPTGLGELNLVEFESNVLGSTLRSVRPDSWAEQGFGVFARGDTVVDPTLLLVQSSFGTPFSLLQGALEQSFSDVTGEDFSLTESDPITVEGVEWQTFVADFETQRFLVAATNDVIVTIAGLPEEFDELVDALLVPVIEAIEIS